MLCLKLCSWNKSILLKVLPDFLKFSQKNMHKNRFATPGFKLNQVKSYFQRTFFKSAKTGGICIYRPSLKLNAMFCCKPDQA
jgi:hypothetical protein